MTTLCAVSMARAATTTPSEPAPAAHLQGVVLYHDPALGLFVQVGDETVQVTGGQGDPLTPGDRVDVTGAANVKDGRRTLSSAKVTRLGGGGLPPARAIATTSLATEEGKNDWVSFVGVIQEVLPTSAGFDLRVAVDESQVFVAAPANAPRAGALVDADVQIRGVRVLQRNAQGIVTGVRVLAPTVTAANVQTPPPGEPFELPLQSLLDVRRLALQHAFSHRVRTRGTVVLQTSSLTPGRHVLHLQDGNGALAVEFDQRISVRTGAVAEVSGFPGTFFGTPVLSSSAIRAVGEGKLPKAARVTVAEVMGGKHAGELVKLRGTFRAVGTGPGYQILNIESGGTPVPVYQYDWPPHAALPSIRDGSTLELEGVTAVFYDGVGAPTTVVMVISGPEAVAIVAVPSWWTPGRAVTALGIAAGICVLAFLWIGILNARVRTQTRALTTQFERTAALQRRWTDLVASASDVILTWDRQGRLTSLNTTGETILGLPEDAALRHTLKDIVASDCGHVVETLMAHSPEASTDRIELEVVGADGRRIPLELNVQPMFEHQEHVGFQAIARDMTQHKQVERALREARDAAEDANRAKSEFLANMSHEIRTPMNGVIGMTQLALMTDLTETQRDYLETANRSAESLLGILNSILDFSKIESRKLDMESVPFELRDLAAGTLKPLTVAAEAKGLELIVDIAPDVPDALVGDPLRLRQVITNLVGNAIKFTERGHVLLEIREDRHADSGTMLHFSVSDTGVGIAREKQPLMFEPFSQADGSTTRRYGGTGLGLAISSSLVALMGGRMWLDSEPGEGSTFHFLAAFGVAGGASRAALDTYPASSAAHGALPARLRRKVLLVEDNVINQRVAVGLLSKRGHDVTAVGNGKEALDRLDRGHFDVILMDVQMPEMGGLEATGAIRQREAGTGRHVWIVAMTAHTMEGDRDQCLKAGMDTSVAKPVDPARLFAAVEQIQPSAPGALAEFAIEGHSQS